MKKTVPANRTSKRSPTAKRSLADLRRFDRRPLFGGAAPERLRAKRIVRIAGNRSATMEHLAAEPLRGARVLVVEDEYYLADDLMMTLREAGAEPVGPFASIAQAEASLGDSGVDAAIVDMNLRGEMAFDFAAGLCSKVPCVVVSGYTAEALPDSVANLCRLEKPVDPKKVLAELSRQMRGKS